MIYISHLIPDEKMKFFVEKYGVGVESIDFSISDNLDQLSRSIEYCREKLKYKGPTDSARPISGCESLRLRQSGKGSHHDPFFPVL